jgi:pilus assembly protein CpaE
MSLTDARFLLTLLICSQKKLSNDLTPLVTKALPLAPVQGLAGYPSRPQLVQLLRSFRARLCFLEFTDTPNDAFQTLDTLKVLAPDLPVVAVLSGNRQELVLECLRRGAAEFLTVPLTPEQLNECLTKVMRLIRTPSDESVGGKIVAVAPAKANAGATTLACSLAAAVKKRASGKALLADLDPLTGTVSFLLRLKSGYSFMDVLQRSSQLDSDLWKQMVLPSNGFEVLLAPEAAADPNAEITEADSLLQFAQARYDTVIVDLAPGGTQWNLSVAAACDELLLVCTNELLSLHAAQRMLAWWERSGIEMKKVRLVVNRYSAGQGLVAERIPEALGQEVFAVLPSDSDGISKALMDAKPAGSGTAFGREVAKLATRLLPEEKKEETGQEKQKKGLLGGLFARK